MLQVRRLGHATLTTPDLDRAIAYYLEIIGLTLIARDKRRAILASRQGLEAIALEPGPPNALARLSFQVAPGLELSALARALAQEGIESERRSGISPGIADAIVFSDPKGTEIEIFSEYAFAAEDRTPAAIVPLKLGHVAYRVADVQVIVKFYTEVLGFRVSDWRDETFAFLRCGPDHHTVNFVVDEIDGVVIGPAAQKREGLVAPANGLPRTTFIWCGDPAATSSATTSRSITATRIRFGSSSSARWTS